MRGKRAKEIRRMVYRDYSPRLRGDRPLIGGKTPDWVRNFYQRMKRTVSMVHANKLSE